MKMVSIVRVTMHHKLQSNIDRSRKLFTKFNLTTKWERLIGILNLKWNEILVGNKNQRHYNHRYIHSSLSISAILVAIFFWKGIWKSGKSTSHPNRSRLTSFSLMSSPVVGCLVQALRGVYVMSSHSSKPPARADAARSMDPLRCWERASSSDTGLPPPACQGQKESCHYWLSVE